MNGVISAVKLHSLQESEELPGIELAEKGQLTQIDYHIYDHKHELLYQVTHGDTLFVNLSDHHVLSFNKREELYYSTCFQLKESVFIEVAGLKRRAAITSIHIRWQSQGSSVSYGVEDRTGTSYFGVRENQLLSWNSPEGLGR
ncbi:hypothetical protein [Bacillus sp. KH172YL63]|uniref:hypothetical protein n=1 Tax=Bacillus sp. KH172YL63 TaxID=2709784 RepID=UPI0013E480CC|nr:hypothetical protein [Bacillus sp. KH172YL63]BCB03662.1 hypothetical protein KH172YL63_17950 [Bacillus sp. KH172YL63]